MEHEGRLMITSNSALCERITAKRFIYLKKSDYGKKTIRKSGITSIQVGIGMYGHE
jgi:hypothetical protein